MASDDSQESIWEVMRTARSVRQFRDEPVEDSVLLRCLEAATWAPSAGNRQPWRFVVLRSSTARRALDSAARGALELIQTTYRLDRPGPNNRTSRARTAQSIVALHESADRIPAAVLFAVRRELEIPLFAQGASIYPALQNFLLATRAVGLGAVVTGWHVTGEHLLRRAVGVPPAWQLAALVVVGWPQSTNHRPVRRRPVARVVYFDHWGSGSRHGQHVEDMA